MKALSKFLLAIVLTLVSFRAYADAPGAYVSVGGGIETRVKDYPGREMRYPIQLEVGYNSFALPLSISFGEDVTIFGVKPRYQYWISLDSDSKLLVAPGLGVVFNYWSVDLPPIVGPTGSSVYEFGAQLSTQLRYNITDMFFVNVVPFAFDFNFWRHINLHSAPGGFDASDSNHDFGIIYSGLLSLGAEF